MQHADVPDEIRQAIIDDCGSFDENKSYEYVAGHWREIPTTILDIASGPVIPGLEIFEMNYAKDQKEYRTLRALRSMKTNGAILTRWTLSPHQRERIANGDDIFLEVLTFHNALQPVLLSVGEPSAEEIKERYALTIPE